MTTTERINNINDAARRRDLAALQAKIDEINHLDELFNGIRALAPRMQEMARVAGVLVANGYPLGKTYGYTYSYRTCDGRKVTRGEFTENITDGIKHAIGFFVRRPYNFVDPADYTLQGYYGIAGAEHYNDLRIDMETGEVVDGAHIVRNMERFLAGFDEAERKFYEYVDSLNN